MSESSAPGAVADEPADEPLPDERADRPDQDAGRADTAADLRLAELQHALLDDDEDDLRLVAEHGAGPGDDAAGPDAADHAAPVAPARFGVRRDAAGGVVISFNPRFLDLVRVVRTTGPLALVAATLVACTTSSAPPAPPTVRVERASVTTAVSSAGSLSAVTEQNIGFNKAGQLKAVNVKVGQRVVAGDVLATLDDTFFRYTLEEQLGELASQRATLTRLINATTVQGDRKAADQAKDVLSATKDVQDATIESDRVTVDRAEKKLSFDEDARDAAEDQLDAAEAACATSTNTPAPTMAPPTMAPPTMAPPTMAPPTMPPAMPPATMPPAMPPATMAGMGGSAAQSEAQRQRQLQEQFEAALRGRGPGNSTGTGATGGTGTATGGTSPCSQVSSAQSALQQAEATVLADRTSLDQAKAKLDVDEATRRLQEENAQTSVVSTQNALDSDRTDRPSLIAQQRGLVAQQEALVRTAQKDVDDTVLRAPADATVAAVNGVVGEYLQQGSVTTPLAPGSGGAIPGISGSSASTAAVPRPGGTQFIVLDNIDRFEVVVPFEESDAVQISPNQRVNVTFDALPDLELPGNVVSVSPASTSLSSVISYYATVALAQNDPRLKNGQTAQAAVLTQELDDVLTVPNSAVRQQGERAAVTVLGFDGPRVVEFTPGAVGDDRTQVLSGLAAGDEVVVPVSGR